MFESNVNLTVTEKMCNVLTQIYSLRVVLLILKSIKMDQKNNLRGKISYHTRILLVASLLGTVLPFLIHSQSD